MNVNTVDRLIALIDAALAEAKPDPDVLLVPRHWLVMGGVRVGDVVKYHGTHRFAHGEYVVVAVTGGRLTLRDPWYPSEKLSRVRLSSVTRIGEWMPVCRCEHPRVHPMNGPTGHCPRIGCRCPHHP